jgi:polar amino acid transport system substrate-binding protein
MNHFTSGRGIISGPFVAALASLLLALGVCSKPAQEATVTAAPVAAPASSAGASRVYAVGTDTDTDTVVAKKANFEVKFVNTPWEGIFNGLGQGDRDLLVSSITITPEGRQTMDFSAPYFDAHQLIAVRNESKVKAFADLRTLKVGVQTDTNGDETISKLQGKTSADSRRFETTPLAAKELEAGGVDAVVAGNGVVVACVDNNAGSKFRTVNHAAFAPEQYGIAVKKGNAALLAKIDKGLAEIRADGTYDRIYARYRGTTSVGPVNSVAAGAGSAAAASR